jgi:hypothetical protein
MSRGKPPLAATSFLKASTPSGPPCRSQAITSRSFCPHGIAGNACARSHQVRVLALLYERATRIRTPLVPAGTAFAPPAEQSVPGVNPFRHLQINGAFR